MRPVTRALFRILNSEGAIPVELLDIRLVGSSEGSTIYLTNAGEPVTWNANLYTPVAMSHGDVQEKLGTDGGDRPDLDFSITNIDLQMATLLGQHDFNGAKAVLRLCDRRLLTNTRDAIVLTEGEIRGPRLDEQMLSFKIVNAVGLTEALTVPRRIFQKGCNYQYGSASCGAVLERVSTTAQAGTTDSKIILPAEAFVAAGIDDRTEYWANGSILFTSGPCILQSRPIQKIDANIVYVQFPYMRNPGQSECVLRRGCRHTVADCIARQGDSDNYGGYRDVPYGRIRPIIRGNIT